MRHKVALKAEHVRDAPGAKNENNNILLKSTQTLRVSRLAPGT